MMEQDTASRASNALSADRTKYAASATPYRYRRSRMVRVRLIQTSGSARCYGGRLTTAPRLVDAIEYVQVGTEDDV